MRIHEPVKLLRFVGPAVLAAALLAGCGAPTAAKATAPPHVAAVREPIGGGYILVPKTIAKNLTQPPQILLAGTSRGVVLALPPAFAPLPSGRTPQPRWTVWFSSTQRAHQNILNGALLLATFPRGPLSLSGVTGPFALFQSKGTLFSIRLWGRGRAHRRALGALAKGSPSVIARRGYAIFDAPSQVLRVVQLATGRHTSITVAKGQVLYWRGGTVYEGSHPAPLPFPKPYPHTLPQGFKWIAVARLGQPIIAVPSYFSVAEQPGGSSQGVIAKDPQDPGISVTVWSNACAGCYNPAIMAPSVDARSTPVYVQGTSGMHPIGDHGYLTEQPGAHGLVTYNRVAYWPGGGDDDYIVTLPGADRALATKILSTAWLP